MDEDSFLENIGCVYGGVVAMAFSSLIGDNAAPILHLSPTVVKYNFEEFDEDAEFRSLNWFLEVRYNDDSMGRDW